MIKPIETEYKGYRFRSRELPAQPMKKMSARADRTGQRFGRLTVMECLGVANVGYRWWGCICDCGEKIAVRSRELDRGHTRSCGCLQAETRANYPGRNKLPYGHASRNELLGSYKKSAKERGIPWELEEQEFFDIVSAPCTYCGIAPQSVRKPNKGVNGEYIYSGVDRIDNALGYTTGNVTSCCWNCNRAKGEMGIVEFLDWYERIAAYDAARRAQFEFGRNGAR